MILTERARQAIMRAERLAFAEAAKEVTTNHLVRALLLATDSVACRALRRLGLDSKALAEQLGPAAGAAGPAAHHPGLPAGADEIGKIPFTLAAKGLIDEAAEQARRLGHHYIGTEHLLLAVAEGSSPEGERLREAGAQPARVREALRELLEAT